MNIKKTPVLYMLLLLLSNHISAQEFIIKDSADVITVHVPLKYKTYTYNTYRITDSCMQIITPKDSLDLYIRNSNQDKTLKVIFSDSKTIKKIKGKENYIVPAGEPVLFSVSSDKNYDLLSDKKISIEYIIHPDGHLCQKYELTENFHYKLAPDFQYGFRYTSHDTGYQPLKLKLVNENSVTETKEFSVKFIKPRIKLRISTEIKDKKGDKEILCTIISQLPLLTDICLTGKIETETNGFKEKLEIKKVIMHKNTKKLSFSLIKNIAGRQPRTFSITSVKFNNECNYQDIEYIYN